MTTDTVTESSSSTGLSSTEALADNAQRTERFDREPQKFVEVPLILKDIHHNPKFRRKSNANARKPPGRIPMARSPRIKVTRVRRLSVSKSSTKRATDISNIMGTKIFMKPPMEMSGTSLSTNSLSTKLTTSTETTAATSSTKASNSTMTSATKGTRRTNNSEAMPSLIAPAPTRSCGSHLSLGLSKNSGVMSSQGSGRTKTGIPYFTTAKLSSNTREPMGSMKWKHAKKLQATGSEYSAICKPCVMKGGRSPRTPLKITTIAVRATEQQSKTKEMKVKGKKSMPSTAEKDQLENKTDGRGSKGIQARPSSVATKKSEMDKTKSKGKKSTPSTVATDTRQSRATSQQSKKSISGTGKKAQKRKEKPSTDASGAKTSGAMKKSNAESGKRKKDRGGPSKPSTPATDMKSSRASTKSKQSKGSGSKSKSKKGKKGKEKVKKLNRKVIYKDMKIAEKKMEDEAKNRKKIEWEKNKLFFYYNCVITRLLDLQKRNHALKKKEASLKMENKDGMFHQNWKNMNLARLQREECLDAKRSEFRSMIRELRDSHKRQTDWLFKDIQTYVKDTYLVGQKYVNDVVGIRMDYTKGLTDTMFEARENLRILEIEQNAKYGPALEEFEEQMRKLRSRIPTERQERLSEMLGKSHGMLVELVNVYTTILHHNYIEVCHTANIINELKSVERRLEKEMTDMEKKRDKIKERTEYLHDRVSNLRRQVNAGKEARKKLHKVLKDQEVLQSKIDLAYIGKEITYQENSRLKAALQEMSERVDRWYFKVKRDFVKDIILDAAKHEERASQLKNYNHLVKYLFNEEQDFLETISNFKDHEEFDDPKEGLKVLLGVYRPHTLYDLEREFEGCTESFTTAIIFFKRRLQQNYMSLDDLHFFIRRRSPLSYLNTVRREETQLKQLMSFLLGSRYGHIKQGGHQGLTVTSSHSFKL